MQDFQFKASLVESELILIKNTQLIVIEMQINLTIQSKRKGNYWQKWTHLRFRGVFYALSVTGPIMSNHFSFVCASVCQQSFDSLKIIWGEDGWASEYNQWKSAGGMRVERQVFFYPSLALFQSGNKFSSTPVDIKRLLEKA